MIKHYVIKYITALLCCYLISIIVYGAFRRIPNFWYSSLLGLILILALLIKDIQKTKLTS